MKAERVLLPLLVLCLIVGAIPAPTLADTYTSMYSGAVDDGKSVQVSGCFVTFGIVNGSNVHVTVMSPDYPDGEAYVPAGNAYYYLNVLRIYVANVTGTQALVDISKVTSGTSTATGTRIWCDTPGQNALGGDVVTFPITIQNNNAYDKTYTLSTTSSTGWDLSYQYNGRDSYQLYVPSDQSRTINLVAKTAYDSSIGEKTIRVGTGDASLDLHVYITSINQSANVAVQVGSLISNIDDKVYYQFSIENLQSQQNNYRLSIEGLPENWDHRYLESTGSTSQLSEVAVPAESTKSFVLQILPPYSVDVGDYNFTAAITTPDNVTIRKALELTLKSGVSMSVTSDKLAYSAQPGETFTIKEYVANTGRGGSLTNVYPDITAPSGWVVSSSPAMVNSIKSGESQVFTITVQSPGNIVASDYDVNVVMKSDQAQSESDYRITITTSSYIPYIGGGIILVVLVGLVFLYKKYGRR